MAGQMVGGGGAATERIGYRYIEFDFRRHTLLMHFVLHRMKLGGGGCGIFFASVRVASQSGGALGRADLLPGMAPRGLNIFSKIKKNEKN